ncbi:MAG: SUMF1/EgtB/PvdO family nonheme iron enzyme [Bacteroidales bacterium]|jgi:formylglycine-generating enzyme required for sulfatase activity|nr:SUMF1/EgtB/PvdO family nonheme iron enzyme [Bacteroidales bacterium]
MKRILILLFALLSLNIVYGQRQTVAIYTEDQSGKGYGDFGVEFITNAIVKRDNYDVVDVTAGFQRLVAAERKRQTSGSVSDAQIRKLGEESGAEFICAVKIGIVDGKYYISGRFIAVESKGVPISARPKFFNSLSDGFEEACETITASMFGERGSGGGSRSNASSGNTQRHPAEPEMISVQGGTFWMGCSGEQGSDCGSDESPLHSVTVSNFQIGKYEVTQKQWRQVLCVG